MKGQINCKQIPYPQAVPEQSFPFKMQEKMNAKKD